MSLIKLDGIGEVQEARIAPEGMYNLQCVKAEAKKSREGDKPLIQLIFQITDESDEEFANIFDTISLPNSEDDQSNVHFKLLMLKRRFFSLDMMSAVQSGEVDTSDFVGARTTVPVKLKLDSYLGKIKNVIEWPFLPDEE